MTQGRRCWGMARSGRGDVGAAGTGPEQVAGQQRLGELDSGTAVPNEPSERGCRCDTGEC